MPKQPRHPRRQPTRQAVILLAFFLFPVVINYLSPYVIIDGASQGVVNGSMIVFGLQFLFALVLGRAWCGWACPAAGLQEAAFAANDRPVRGGRLNWIKWGIWLPWLGIIAASAIAAGGYQTVNFLHLTDSGISVDRPAGYVIYYIVVGSIFVLSLLVGRRAFCHYGCWMAPFMILGRKLSNALNGPALRLKTATDQCIQCQRCTKACPMSLPVHEMVQQRSMENDECILCGTCADTCPKDVIRYAFGRKQVTR